MTETLINPKPAAFTPPPPKDRASKGVLTSSSGNDRAFMTVFDRFFDDENASKNHVNVKKAREELNRTYKQMIIRVNTYAGKDATPTIAAFVTKMNIIVKRFATLMKQHHSHNHHQHGAHVGGESGAPEGGAV